MEWIHTKLNQLLEKNDSGVWGPEDKNLGISILRSNNFTNEGLLDFSELTYRIVDSRLIENKILKKGDILLERSGGSPNQPIGRVCYFESENQNHLFGNFISRLRTKNKICLSKYLFWYLFYFHKSGRTLLLTKKTIGIQNLHYKLYLNIDIPLPPLSEQQRIVEILDQADEIRKLRKQANEKAEKIIPALFYEMFGDIKSNPKNFRKVKMGDVLKVKSGYSLTSAMMNKDGIYPVYGGNGINGYHNQFMFEESKIVIGRVGAYCGNVFYSKPKSWITDNAIYVSEKTSDLIDEFLVYQLKVLNLNRYAGRAGQPLISGNRIYPIEIIIPEKPLQDNFVRRLNNFENTFELRAKSYERINRLFDILLSKAFDGSLTASWRKAHMQELLKEMEEQKKYLEGKINA